MTSKPRAAHTDRRHCWQRLYTLISRSSCPHQPSAARRDRPTAPAGVMAWHNTRLPSAPAALCGPPQPRQSIQRSSPSQQRCQPRLGEPAACIPGAQRRLRRTACWQRRRAVDVPSVCAAAGSGDSGSPLDAAEVERPPLDPDDEIPVASTSDSGGEPWQRDASDLSTEMVSTPIAPQALHEVHMKLACFSGVLGACSRQRCRRRVLASLLPGSIPHSLAQATRDACCHLALYPLRGCVDTPLMLCGSSPLSTDSAHARWSRAQVTAMMAAPFAAVSLEGFAGKLADLRKQVLRIWEYLDALLLKCCSLLPEFLAVSAPLFP